MSEQSILNPEFLNPFISSTLKVLETQCNIQTKPGRPYIKPINEKQDIAVAAVINLSCSAFTGSIVLCFSKETFLNVYEGMLDERPEEIDEEVSDCAGELLNMIFGTSKTILNEKGYALEKAIPTILSGEKLLLKFKSEAPVLKIPFESSAGVFQMQIIFDFNNEK